MARSDVELSDQELIERYVERHPFKAGVAEARLKDYGVSVWALAGYLRAVGGDVAELARAYDLPLEPVEAAVAFYRRHRVLLDERIAANEDEDL